MVVEWDVEGEKTEMVVESAWSEGEVLENCFTVINLVLLKIQDFYFFTVYFIILPVLFDCNFSLHVIHEDLLFVQCCVPSLRVGA